jgi:hypothetical protein
MERREGGFLLAIQGKGFDVTKGRRGFMGLVSSLTFRSFLELVGVRYRTWVLMGLVGLLLGWTV